jgi:hypothetical protein
MITPEEVDLHDAVNRTIAAALIEEHARPLPWLADILSVGCGMFTPWRKCSRIFKDGAPCSILTPRKLMA